MSYNIRAFIGNDFTAMSYCISVFFGNDYMTMSYCINVLWQCLIASLFFSNAVLIIVSEFSLAMIILQCLDYCISVFFGNNYTAMFNYLSEFSLAMIILQCLNYCIRVFFGNDYTAMS